MCLHPVKIAQIMEFLSTLVAAVVVAGAGFLNLHVAGCMEPIYLENNRHAETYMTLPTENPLLS